MTIKKSTNKKSSTKRPVRKQLLTKQQRQYRQKIYKQRTALKKRVANLTQRGYIIPENLKAEIQMLYELPGKTVREAKKYLSRIKNLTVAKILPNLQYSSSLTYGEIVSGEEGRKLERKAKKSGADEGLNVLMNCIDLIDSLSVSSSSIGGAPEEAIQAKLILQREYSLKNNTVLQTAQDNAVQLTEACYGLFASDQEDRKASLADLTNILFSGVALSLEDTEAIQNMRYDEGV